MPGLEHFSQTETVWVVLHGEASGETLQPLPEQGGSKTDGEGLWTQSWSDRTRGVVLN